MFVEHIEKLTLKKRSRFRFAIQLFQIFKYSLPKISSFNREMLDEIGELTLNTAWKKVRSLIKDDPRYAKFSSSDRVILVHLFFSLA